MAIVLRTQLANEDLISIWEFVATQKQEPEAADRILHELNTVMHTLARSPQMGTSAEQYGSSNLRMFTKWSYILFYQPTDNGIRLIRVLHGAQDIERML